MVPPGPLGEGHDVFPASQIAVLEVGGGSHSTSSERHREPAKALASEPVIDEHTTRAGHDDLGRPTVISRRWNPTCATAEPAASKTIACVDAGA